jgi:hypothetical protein
LFLERNDLTERESLVTGRRSRLLDGWGFILAASLGGLVVSHIGQIVLALFVSSRRCSDMTAVGGTPDGRWTRPAPPHLTLNRHRRLQ